MITYVVMHMVVHLVLMMQGFHDVAQLNQVKSFNEMSDADDDCGTSMRKSIAVVYIIFVGMFAIAFVIIIFLSK
jgi:hypothetical protein